MNESSKASKLLNLTQSDILNKILITETGIPFGGAEETISSVIGKNVLNNTLSPVGNLLNMILNFFDPNHSINSIKKN